MAVHLAGLHRVVWSDEACTWWTVQQGLAGLIEGARTDGSPPLYFALVWLVTHTFGSGEVALRAVSVAASTALVPATYLTSRRVLTPRAALFAACTVASSPLINYYAVEARSYALVQLETVIIVFTAWQVLKQPHQRHWWLALAAAQASQLWTHSYGWFMLPVPTLVALSIGGAHRWRTAGVAVGAGAAAALLDVPNLTQAVQASNAGVSDWITPFWLATPPSLSVVRSLEAFGFGGRYPSYLAYLAQAPQWLVLSWLLTGTLLAAAVMRSGVAGRFRVGFDVSLAVRLLLAFVFVPLGAAWVWSSLREPIYLVGRYDTIVLPAFLMLLAAGLDRAWSANRWVGATATAVIVLGGASAVATAVAHTGEADADARAAQRLVREAGAGDHVVVTGLRRSVVEYYLAQAGRTPVLRSYPEELGQHPGWESQTRLLGDRGALVKEAREVERELERTLGSGHRAWILESGPNPVDDYLFRGLTDRLKVDEASSDPASGVISIRLSPDGPGS